VQSLHLQGINTHAWYLFTTILPPPPLPTFSSFSAIAPSNSFNCSSVTLLLNCPDRASMINLFSTFVARDSLTRRMRPRRSAASGVRTWESIELRASASCCLPSPVSKMIRHKISNENGLSVFLRFPTTSARRPALLLLLELRKPPLSYLEPVSQLWKVRS